MFYSMEAYSKSKVDELAALKHAIAMYIVNGYDLAPIFFSHCDSVLKFYRMEIEGVPVLLLWQC